MIYLTHRHTLHVIPTVKLPVVGYNNFMVIYGTILCFIILQSMEQQFFF